MKSEEINALNAITASMEAEMDTYNFYSRAARITQNPKGRDMFSQLADFEMNHFRHLSSLYDSLKGDGKWIAYSGSAFSNKEKKISVDLSIKEDIGSQADDIDALSIAIKEEQKARKYYQEMAQETADPLGRDMFKKLAREEEMHEKVLNDQFYSLSNKGIWTWGD